MNAEPEDVWVRLHRGHEIRRVDTSLRCIPCGQVREADDTEAADRISAALEAGK